MPQWGSIRAGYADKVKLEDLYEVYDIAQAKRYEPIRMIGPITSIGMFWFEITNAEGKAIRFPKVSLSYDPEKQSCDPDVEDPYRDLADEFGVRITVQYITQIINRKMQKQKPARLPPPTEEEVASGFKIKGTSTWTPIQVAPFVGTVINKVQGFITELNVREFKDPKTGKMRSGSFPPNHPRFGYDVQVKYDGNLKGTAKYDVQMGEKTSLSQEEREYLMWDLDQLKQLKESLGEARDECKRMRKKLVPPDDMPQDLERPAPRGGKSGKNSRKPVAAEDLPEDLEDDFSPPAPVARGRTAAPKRQPAQEEYVNDDVDFADGGDFDDTEGYSDTTAGDLPPTDDDNFGEDDYGVGDDDYTDVEDSDGDTDADDLTPPPPPPPSRQRPAAQGRQQTQPPTRRPATATPPSKQRPAAQGRQQTQPPTRRTVAVAAPSNQGRTQGRPAQSRPQQGRPAAPKRSQVDDDLDIDLGEDIPY